MPKGISQRRRLKRAVEAARGNLHRIANGKALRADLPEAPKPKDTEKLPASLRKMLALKEAATQKKIGGPKGSEAASRPVTKGSSQDKWTPRVTNGNGGADDGPSTSGRDAVAGETQQQPAEGGNGGGDRRVKGASAFAEPFVQKKLKDKKKEFLKRKKEKKEKKGASGQVVVEKELQLKDHVKFGEVVHAPLEVHLKRKHWADKEKSANERCKEVFLKQMQQAQQRLAGDGAVADGVGAGGRTHSGGSGAGTKKRKRATQMDAATEELRQQVIESYRATKKGGSSHNTTVGHATMASLSHLVAKSGGNKAASAGGGKSHTLT